MQCIRESAVIRRDEGKRTGTFKGQEFDVNRGDTTMSKLQKDPFVMSDDSLSSSSGCYSEDSLSDGSINDKTKQDLEKPSMATIM